LILNELAIVESTEEIAFNTFQTFLDSPQISASIKPGQFVNILPSDNWDKMMRRPMSVASQRNGKISIIYKVVGQGTEFMKNWIKGDNVDLIGPLGNYWEGYSQKYSILIGGGVGIAPILNLYIELEASGEDNFLIMGARNSAEHFMDHLPGNGIYMTTDDGSLGIHGNVLEPLKLCLQNIDRDMVKVFACGPPAMMEAVRQFSMKNNIECDLALETLMACGIGICQGCTVEFEKKKTTTEHSYRNRFGLVCMDGTIFESKEIKTCHL
jgi:dihydroorotate dehydrogenase electron transfer subunit